VQLQSGQDVVEDTTRGGAGAHERGSDEAGSVAHVAVQREIRGNRATHGTTHISSQVDGHAGMAGKISQSFCRVTPRRWCLKPPLSPLNPPQFPGPPDMSGTLGLQLSSSHAPSDLMVSGPSEDIPERALGLRDSPLDCSQSNAGFHHPAASSPVLPYQQQQGREQQSHASISRPVLLEGIHPQSGQAFRGPHRVSSSGVGTSGMMMTSAAVGVTQLIQFQKCKQEAGFSVGGTSYDSPNRVGSSTTKVTELIIKKKDASSLIRPSSLPPLSLFKPFKHVTEQQQQECRQGKGKVDERVSLLTPLFHPLTYLGIDDVERDGIAGGCTEKLDKHAPVLMPLYEPFKHHVSSRYSHDSRADKQILAEKSLILTPIFTPFKCPKDRHIQRSNEPSQCSSKTSSLPPNLVASLELDTHDSVDGREGRSGQNSDTDSKRNRGSSSSVYALQLSYNSSPTIIPPADRQIQLLQGHHGDTGVRSLGFDVGCYIPHVPTATSRGKQLSNEDCPPPNPPHRTTASKSAFDNRSQVVKDLSSAQLLELAKGSSSTQGTGSHVRGPVGQPHIHLNNQLDGPVRDPRGFYFPVSEGSCGSNPCVAVGNNSTAAGQYAPLFQPASSSGHTVANNHLYPATQQPAVYRGGSRVSVGPHGEAADLQRQNLQRRMGGTMEFVRAERETGIAKRKGQPDGRMGENLQEQPEDGHDGALLKKRTQDSPRAFDSDPSLTCSSVLASTPPKGEEEHIEEKLQCPAQSQGWLQHWMPLSNHGSDSVKPEASLPDASRLHVDGKSEHDHQELQRNNSTTEANQPIFREQENPNVDGSLGSNPRRPSVFGPGIPSVAALALLGAATRTTIP
jgi:hypothetical protein